MASFPAGIRLDIACGANKNRGFVGLDIRPLPGVDIVCDVNQHPWPLEDECCIQAMASHLLEHIPGVAIDNGHTRFPFIEFMDEVWRILRPGCEFYIVVPHGNSQGFMQDPTHVNAMNQTRWAYFDPINGGNLYQIYKPKPWEIRDINWSPEANMEVVLAKRGLNGYA
jgi:hypothetical protein